MNPRPIRRRLRVLLAALVATLSCSDGTLTSPTSAADLEGMWWLPLACTLAACASAPIDTRFTGLLTGPLTVRLNNRLLQLNDAQGGELRFQK